MRGILVKNWTEPQFLSVVDLPEPGARAGSVKIKVMAAPVSHALGLLIRGKYQRRPPLPFVPGNTVVGEIVEIGEECQRGFTTGQYVLASLEYGGLAEYAIAEEVNVYALPGGVDAAKATALNTSYNSVLAALTWPRLLDVKPASWLLVHGAAGGTGSAAIEVARELGARVIASASTKERRDWAMSIGAEFAIASDPEGLKEAVMEITGGSGVAAVLDPVGGELFTQSIRCLAPEGRVLPLGFASGAIPTIAANLILVKNISVCGLYMGYYKIDQRYQYESTMRDIFDRLGHWLAEGKINPKIDSMLPLEDISTAFQRISSRERIGQVVMRP